MWEYRAIDLGAKATGEDEIDLLNRAGEQGWELITITPPYRAMLRRPRGARVVTEAAPARAAVQAPAMARAVAMVSAPPAPTPPVAAPAEESRVAAKYRDPATGDTWSGRGRMANWLASKVKSGESIEKYLISQS